MRQLTIKMCGYCFYGFRKKYESSFGMPTYNEAERE